VARGGAGEADLGRWVEDAQERSQGHGEAPAIELEAELRGEATGEGETALNPGLLPAEEL